MLVIFGMSRPPPFLKKHQIPKNTLSSKGATTVPSLKHYLGCRKIIPEKSVHQRTHRVGPICMSALFYLMLLTIDIDFVASVQPFPLVCAILMR